MKFLTKKVSIISLFIALLLVLTGCASSTDLKYFVYNSWVSDTMEVSEYIGSDTDVKIPDKINGKPVVFLPFTFKDNDNLISVTLPDTDCVLIETFSGCDKLTTVNFSRSMTAIGEKAFYRCEKLRDVTIPSGVSRIEAHAFYGCSSLGTVTIPNSVTYIGDGAFTNCSASVAERLKVNPKKDSTASYIPGSAKTIGNRAFAGCNLQNIIIEEGVETIGDEAFFTDLISSVTIPKSVTSIGKNAFCEDVLFGDPTSAEVTLHVYKGSYAEEYALQNGYIVKYIKEDK